jgi:hypothetical protein
MTKIYNNLNTKTVYAESDDCWYVFKNKKWEPCQAVPTENMKLLNSVTWGKLYESFNQKAY